MVHFLSNQPGREQSSPNGSDADTVEGLFMGDFLGSRALEIPDDSVRSPSRARIELLRHDNHNLELKSTLPLPAGYGGAAVEWDLQLCLFSPGSLQLRSWEKEELASDFRSRVRLSRSTRSLGDLAALGSSLERLRRELADARGSLDAGSADAALDVSQRVQPIRRLGADLHDGIKTSVDAILREILLLHSLIHRRDSLDSEFRRLADRIGALRTSAGEVRRAIAGARTDEGDPAIRSALCLLSEYAESLCVGAVARIRGELSRVTGLSRARGADSARREEEVRPILSVLDLFQEDLIAQRRLDERERDPQAGILRGLDSELRLVRLGQLKKFFQAENYVELSRRETMGRLAEPLAIGATGFAGMAAALLEHSLNPNWTSFGLNSVIFTCFGVFLYVLRDRIKDRGRVYLQGRIHRFLPEREQWLISARTRIGRIQEWFSVRSAAALSDGWKRLRQDGYLSFAEGWLSEDAIEFRRRIRLFPRPASRLSVGESERLHEVLRINLARHFKFMDDPFKLLHQLDDSGLLREEKSHRVYLFHLGMRLGLRKTAGRAASGSPAGVEECLYRIVCDQAGIRKVERLSSSF